MEAGTEGLFGVGSCCWVSAGDWREAGVMVICDSATAGGAGGSGSGFNKPGGAAVCDGALLTAGWTVMDSGIEYIDVDVLADCVDSLLRLGFWELSAEGDAEAVRTVVGIIVDTDSPLLLKVGIACCDVSSMAE